MIACKVFTHDLRPPIQGGDPAWDGSLPYALPPVEVDMGDSECAAGWSAAARPADALRIAGLWPDGRPSRMFTVEAADAAVIARGDKLRAASWTITRECSASEIEAAIGDLSKVFGPLRAEMTAEQIAWRVALGRPERDEHAVEAGLRAALAARGLVWELRRYDTAWAARDAWDAWAAWDSRAARDAWDAWDARDAWAARDALIVRYAARMGWVSSAPDLFTVGLRDAYRCGLAVAVPVGPGMLGWSMEGGR